MTPFNPISVRTILSAWTRSRCGPLSKVNQINVCCPASQVLSLVTCLFVICQSLSYFMCVNIRSLETWWAGYWVSFLSNMEAAYQVPHSFWPTLSFDWDMPSSTLFLHLTDCPASLLLSWTSLRLYFRLSWPCVCCRPRLRRMPPSPPGACMLHLVHITPFPIWTQNRTGTKALNLKSKAATETVETLCRFCFKFSNPFYVSQPNPLILEELWYKIEELWQQVPKRSIT